MTTKIATLEALCNRINEITNSPLASYSKDAQGKFHANPGNYHLDGAYGGWMVCRMSNMGGGTSHAIGSSHMPKRQLEMMMRSFISGLEAK